VHFSATGAEQVFRDWLRAEVISIYRAHLAGHDLGDAETRNTGG
jgi:hypothetical protein